MYGSSSVRSHSIHSIHIIFWPHLIIIPEITAAHNLPRCFTCRSKRSIGTASSARICTELSALIVTVPLLTAERKKKGLHAFILIFIVQFSTRETYQSTLMFCPVRVRSTGLALGQQWMGHDLEEYQTLPTLQRHPLASHSHCCRTPASATCVSI